MLGGRLGAGRQAEVYDQGDGAVVKLYRFGHPGHEAEAAALSALDGQGIAPSLMDVIECDGRTGLVLKRLDGPDMLTVLNRRPWRVLTQAHQMAKAHLAIHRVLAPPALPGVREVIATKIGDAGLSGSLRGFALQTLDRLPDGTQLLHGDFHPGNVLCTAGGAGVIDWPGAARGAPEAGHAHTLLLLRWAQPLPDTPWLSRMLTSAGRRLFARSYARAYTAHAPHPLRQLNLWLAVHAAARLAEGISAERPALTGLVQRAARTAATERLAA